MQQTKSESENKKKNMKDGRKRKWRVTSEGKNNIHNK